MMPSEVLEQAHEDSARIGRELRRIEEMRVELRDRIGVQGHGYERTPKNDIRDPMRHVCEAIDGNSELDVEEYRLRDLRRKSLAEAAMLIRGVRKYDSESDDMVITTSERLLWSYCIEGRHMVDVAYMLHMQTDTCTAVYLKLLERCDEIGIARLKHAGKVWAMR